MVKRVISVIIAITAATGTGVSCKDAKDPHDHIREEISSVVEEISVPDVTKPIKNVEEIISEKKQELKENDPYIKNNLGTVSLTFYVPDAQWGYNTATGERPVHLGTCAVDPRVIPYGSVIKIVGNNGQTIILRANDCGGGIKGNKIDIFWDTAVASVSDGYKWMDSFGTIHAVYLLEE